MAAEAFVNDGGQPATVTVPDSKTVRQRIVERLRDQLSILRGRLPDASIVRLERCFARFLEHVSCCEERCAKLRDQATANLVDKLSVLEEYEVSDKMPWMSDEAFAEFVRRGEAPVDEAEAVSAAQEIRNLHLWQALEMVFHSYCDRVALRIITLRLDREQHAVLQEQHDCDQETIQIQAVRIALLQTRLDEYEQQISDFEVALQGRDADTMELTKLRKEVTKLKEDRALQMQQAQESFDALLMPIPTQPSPQDVAPLAHAKT